VKNPEKTESAFVDLLSIGGTAEAPDGPDGEGLSMSSLLDCDIVKKDWLKETCERKGFATAAALRAVDPNQKALGDAGPWEPAMERILAFRQRGGVPEGQAAGAPTGEVMASAIALAYMLLRQGVDPPSRVVQGPGGSVVFQWQDEDQTHTDVEVVGWLLAEVMLIERGLPPKRWTIPIE
jgi:hypothetical protein